MGRGVSHRIGLAPGQEMALLEAFRRSVLPTLGARMSVEQLADETGVSASYLHAVCEGSRRLTLEVVLLVQRACGLPWLPEALGRVAGFDATVRPAVVGQPIEAASALVRSASTAAAEMLDAVADQVITDAEARDCVRLLTQARGACDAAIESVTAHVSRRPRVTEFRAQSLAEAERRAR